MLRRYFEESADAQFGIFLNLRAGADRAARGRDGLARARPSERGGDDVPYVSIRVTDDGITREQKAAVIAGVTRVLVDELGKQPEAATSSSTRSRSTTGDTAGRASATAGARPIRPDRWPRGSLRPVAAFVLLTLVLGSSYFFTALALREWGPTQIVFLRVLIGFAALAALVVVKRVPLPRERRLYRHLVVVAMVSIAIPFVLVTVAQQHVDTSLASIVVGTAPIIVYLLSIARRTARLTVGAVAGSLLAFGGVVGLALAGGISQGLTGWLLAILLCAVLFAVGNVYLQATLAGVHPISLAFVQLGIALVPLGAVMMLTEGIRESATARPLLGLLCLRVLSSGLAFLLFSYLILAVGSSTAALNTYLQPVVGLALGCSCSARRSTGDSGSRSPSCSAECSSSPPPRPAPPRQP